MKKTICKPGKIVTMFIVFLFCIGATLAWADCWNDDEFTQDFNLEECHFVSDDSGRVIPCFSFHRTWTSWWKSRSEGGNPYFSLDPGYRLVLEGVEEEDGEEEEIFVAVTVTNDLHPIEFEYGDETIRLMARVVTEDEYVDGEIVERSWNYFSRCQETNAVYYFGEWVDNYEDGEVDNHDGSWVAGVNDALPGLMMPGTFLLGSKYFQEVAWDDDAADRGENTEIIEGVLEVNDYEFEGCVEVVDTNPVEGVCEAEDGDVKIYCPGIGLVVDEEIELTCYGYNCPGSPEPEEE